MLEIAELCYVMEKGTTEPINCRLSDGTEAVIKYPNNQCGTATLINEWIGYSVSKQVGITTPAFGLCKLDSEIIYSNQDIDVLDERNTGTCFYSKYMSKAIPLVTRTCVVNHETEKIIIVDHLLNNCDRHKGNLFYDLNTSVLYTIDYSHLFSNDKRPNLNPEYIEKAMDPDSFLNTSILEKNQSAYDLLSYSAGFEVATVLLEADKMKSLLSHDFLVDVLNDLPEDWTQAVGMDGLNKIIDFIEIRVSNLDKIADIIISWGRRI